MSIRKDGSYVKKMRLSEISKMIAATMPDGVEYAKVLIGIQYNLGLSKARSIEYLNLVLEAQGWVVREGKIVSGETET